VFLCKPSLKAPESAHGQGLFRGTARSRVGKGYAPIPRGMLSGRWLCLVQMRYARSARVIQNAFRRHVTLKALRHRRAAATSLQCAWRCKLAKRELRQVPA
jgi:hypothetical protein